MPRCRLFADQSLHKKFARKQAYALFSCRSCLLTSYVKSSVLTCVSPSVRAVISVSQNSNTFLSFVFVVQGWRYTSSRCRSGISKNPYGFSSDFPSDVQNAFDTNYFLASLGLLAPYLERACFLLATPAVSRVPRMMWYLVPGRSLTRPPRIKTTLCSCRL